MKELTRCERCDGLLYHDIDEIKCITCGRTAWVTPPEPRLRWTEYSMENGGRVERERNLELLNQGICSWEQMRLLP